MTSKQINAFLRDAIPADPTKQTVITHIPKEKVQSVIDTAWERLDDKTNLIHPTLTPSSQSALLRKLCLKLAATHDVLPTSFYVEDVVCLNLEAVDAGAYADILQGQYNGRLVILKRPRIPNPRMKDKVMMEFCRESLLWSKLQHKHVLPFIGVSKDVFSRGMICMILPLMEAGNIRRRISTTDPGKQLTSTTFEAHVNRWLYEVALGLAYLHDHGVVHGDLHGGNILIDADDHALLTDFGFSVIAEATAGAYGSKHGGAAQHFMAPELWDPDEFGLTHARYTPATDAYGFGCTCIELYTGKMPFAGPKMTAFKISMKVLDGKRPPRPSTPFDTPMSDRMWAVVEASWAQQPGERLKAADIAKSMEAFV